MIYILFYFILSYFYIKLELFKILDVIIRRMALRGSYLLSKRLYDIIW